MFTPTASASTGAGTMPIEIVRPASDHGPRIRFHHVEGAPCVHSRPPWHTLRVDGFTFVRGCYNGTRTGETISRTISASCQKYLRRAPRTNSLLPTTLPWAHRPSHAGGTGTGGLRSPSTTISPSTAKKKRNKNPHNRPHCALFYPLPPTNKNYIPPVVPEWPPSRP